MTDTLASLAVSSLRRAYRVSAGVGATAVAGTAAFAGVIWVETKVAKRRIPVATDPPPVSHDTVWAAAGVSPTRPAISLAVLGDSSAAGYGAERDRDTPAAQLAIGISEAARRPVHVSNVAVVGAESKDLPAQLAALGRTRADVALIMIGVNDVTERTSPADAVPYLERTVTALRDLGSEVVVGTCPDLGSIKPLNQPLRAFARRLSRQMAKEQTIAVVRAGGRTVSLGDLLGPLFKDNLYLFAPDMFHPSAAGYAEAAAALLPSVLDALGIATRARSASTFTTRRVKPVARAAAQAVARPGTEVAAAERFGRSANRRGPLAQLRRRLPRRGQRSPAPEAAVPVHVA